MARQQIDLGTATIEPGGPVVAGSWVTIRYTYTAGHPIDDTGYLKIAFRYAGDFGRPQFGDPGAPNYCRVETTGDCWIEARWDPKGNTRPWGRSIWLKVMGGYLDRGETIDLVFGDRSQGSRGWQIQSFCEETFEFKTLVDPIATFEFKELPQSPELEIVPDAAVRAVCIAPSVAEVGAPFSYHLKLEDRWGNPTRSPQQIAHPGFSESGTQWVSGSDPVTGLSAQSNPIQVRERAAALLPFWADFHGQSEETIGTNSIDRYFSFARDDALLDISAHQGNDFQVTDPFWAQVEATAQSYYAPDQFCTFPGYEWSGNTPLGGDRNVYFVGEGGCPAHSCADLLPDKSSDFPITPTADALFAHLAQQRAPRAFAFAHVGGRYADLRMHHPEVELAVEIHSAWGTFEWLVEDALRLGYRVGICANSDGHKCRPGASFPGANKFGSYGGLTCVLARRLTRESIYAALAARHFYATTGNRSLLDVRLALPIGQEAMMGDIAWLNGSGARLCVSAVGTAPIEEVQVRNGCAMVQSLRPYARADLGRRIKVVWRGAEVRGRARKVSWDGWLEVEENQILDVAPINFWNPDQAPAAKGNRVTWQSITTGGISGLILTLARAGEGRLVVDTEQGRVELPVDQIGLEPESFSFGGVDKGLDIYALPDAIARREVSFDLGLSDLAAGDNPIWVRITQEDGHMAWSSPIYLHFEPE